VSDADIPSGKDVRDSQADGSARSAVPEPAAADSEMHFESSAVWNGDATGSGEVRLVEGSLGVPIAGSVELGGSGGAANPEELLLAALASCFINTWAIFLTKLQIPYAQPAIRVRGNLGKDPAGGFILTGATVSARVPDSLLTGYRGRIGKSLELAEKYCIISKVVRAAMPLKVEIEAV
jgi:organic hydroperoxide reductase OsmC/OhrA